MEKDNEVVIYQCFIKKGEKFLMTKVTEDGIETWLAIGDMQESNVNLLENMEKSVLKQTNLKITNPVYKVQAHTHLEEENKDLYFYVFMADYESGDFIVAGDTNEEHQWLTKQEIYALPNLLEELQTVLDSIFSDDLMVATFDNDLADMN